MVKVAERVIDRCLDGCGLSGTDVMEDGNITRIARRQCTDQERKRVLEKYLQV